jgi:hypothetical protein
MDSLNFAQIIIRELVIADQGLNPKANLTQSKH